MYRPEVSKCHAALKQRKALNPAVTPTHIQQSRRRSLHAMQQIYAAICLISTRKVPRHGLDFRVSAILKSQWKTVAAGNIRHILQESRSSLRQTERLLARATTTGANFDPWQPLCLRTCMVRQKCSSLQFQRSVQKYSHYTSGITN